MTKDEAMKAAKAQALNLGLIMAVVAEGPHADDEAQRDGDGDGESYGYCPVDAVVTLYPRGTVVAKIGRNGEEIPARTTFPKIADYATVKAFVKEAGRVGYSVDVRKMGRTPFSITVKDGEALVFKAVNMGRIWAMTFSTAYFEEPEMPEARTPTTYAQHVRNLPVAAAKEGGAL